MSSAFFSNYARSAQSASRQTGVLASVILAQWADETQYGQSPAFRNGHNFAGVSYGGTVTYFADETAGLNAYITVLNQHTYDGVRAAKGAQAQAIALGSSAWAASHYDMNGYNARRPLNPGVDLLSIISTNNLTVYDTGTPPAGSPGAPTSASTTPDAPPAQTSLEPDADNFPVALKLNNLESLMLGGQSLADWAAPGQPIPRAARLADLVAGEESQVDLTADQVSQIVLKFADPTYELLDHGLGLLGTTAEYIGWQYLVAVVETTDDSGRAGVALTLRSRGAQRLKQDIGNSTWEGLSPTQVMQMLCAKQGLGFVGQGSAVWPSITRIDPTMGGRILIDVSSGQYLIPESAWSLGQRLAAYLGYIFFEAGGTVYFGKPSWLYGNMPVVDINASTMPAGDPPRGTFRTIGPAKARRSLDDLNGLAVLYKIDCATVTLPLDHGIGEQIRPGMAVNLDDSLPTFQGGYIVTRVQWTFDNAATPVLVTAERPVDPVPQLPSDVAAGSPGATALPATGTAQPARASGHASALDFVSLALSVVGAKYQWGALADPNNPHPAAFDCSELVQWAATRLGVSMPRTSGQQWQACSGHALSVAGAMKVRGALLFVDNSSGPGGQHVAISLGDGQTVVEALNTRYGTGVFPANYTPFNRAALIPAMDYGYGVGAAPPGVS